MQRTAFFVAMGAQPVGLLEVDAKLRWRGVRWLSRILRRRGAERHRAHPAAFAPAQTTDRLHQVGGSDPARNGGGGERAAVAKTVLFYKKGKCDRSSHSRLGSLPTRSVLSGG